MVIKYYYYFIPSRLTRFLPHIVGDREGIENKNTPFFVLRLIIDIAWQNTLHYEVKASLRVFFVFNVIFLFFSILNVFSMKLHNQLLCNPIKIITHLF